MNRDRLAFCRREVDGRSLTMSDETPDKGRWQADPQRPPFQVGFKLRVIVTMRS
jgi:hypothetical protein